ncbi:hypothetical protein [Paracidovorax cattleyae]|uniref:Uncharacterized protein n=1 Tax=Paracidovorax cattleyae TaxID=80868 RepID=A0A1H0RFN9_9BURK|nr:hypothetical protein [Paracidovorax cattleyae]SDP28432.1 hypothetical protein SAMN04489708_11047 [Paracidovorax cattleyae]
MARRIGLSQEQAFETLWVMTTNLSRLLAWLVFWIAHLLLALLGAVLLWWFQVTPADVIQALTGASQSATASVAGFLGVSAAGLLGGYLAAARWVWKKTYVRWQINRLLEGIEHD